MVIEVKEAPVPVKAWDVHETGHEVPLSLAPGLFEAFTFVSMRPLKVELSNGQIVIVRAKK